MQAKCPDPERREQIEYQIFKVIQYPAIALQVSMERLFLNVFGLPRAAPGYEHCDAEHDGKDQPG